MTKFDLSIAVPWPRVVTRFMSWWLGELAGAAAALREAGRRRRTVLFFSSAGLDILVLKSGKTQKIANIKPGGKKLCPRDLQRQLRIHHAAGAPVIARLARDQVLERNISIPIAAEDVLAPVLRNQIECFVPWPPADTCFGYEVIGRDTAKGQLETRIVATRRDMLEKAQEEAGKIGLKADFIEQADSADADRGIMMMDLNGPDRMRVGKILGRWLGGLVALCLLASIFSLTQLFKERDALARIEGEITKTKSRLDAQDRQQAEQAALSRQQARLIDRKLQGPSAVSVLETLSHVLPDNAWLTEFELRGKQVRLQGKSKNAANLIRVIETAPHYAQARFSAPTTRNSDSNLETFVITAEVVPGVMLED